ncbi:MAG: bifunctional pyr operon transcriptional regulator/uracil phosphoribosyltransferase PyrR [Clostridia bacterium]
MEIKALILDDKAISRALIRISHEIIENNNGVDNICLVGIKTRGVPLANRIAENIENFEGQKINVGCLDITFFRDDLEDITQKASIDTSEINFNIVGKDIILVDDVLFTGRTVRAGIDAIISLGRPKSIQFATLIDRGHRELPIRPDYVGKNLPTSRSELVKVQLLEIDDKDEVILINK